MTRGERYPGPQPVRWPIERKPRQHRPDTWPTSHTSSGRWSPVTRAVTRLGALLSTRTARPQCPMPQPPSNACITWDRLLLRMAEKDFTDVMDTNVTGVFRVIKRVAGSQA